MITEGRELFHLAISTEVRGARANPELRTRATQALQQTAQQRPQLASELQNDQSKLSEELLDEVGKAGQAQGTDNLDSLLGAMAQNFMDRKAEEAKPGQDSKEDKKKMEVEWAPDVRPGELMQPQGYTGQLIYKESKDQPKDEGVKPAGKAGKAGKSAAQPGKGPAAAGGAKPAAPVGANNSSKKTGDDQNSKSDDTVELTAESQQMAQKMQQGGMKPNGVDSKGDKQGGAKGEERVDVFMPAAGMTQIVDVSSPGKLGPDGILGTYRKLDDMPSFNGAILRKRTGKEMLQEYNQRRERGEKLDPLTEEQQQKLINPVATSK